MHGHIWIIQIINYSIVVKLLQNYFHGINYNITYQIHYIYSLQTKIFVLSYCYNQTPRFGVVLKFTMSSAVHNYVWSMRIPLSSTKCNSNNSNKENRRHPTSPVMLINPNEKCQGIYIQGISNTIVTNALYRINLQKKAIFATFSFHFEYLYIAFLI